MGRQIPVSWDEVPDSTLLPVNLYKLEVDDLTEEQSKAGAFMYRAVHRVVEPADFAGVPLYDYFAIGTADDPQAEDEKTWKNSIGVRRFKRLAKACNVPLTTDMDEMVEAIKGQQFVAAVDIETDDGVRDPKYKGVQRNRIQAMHSIAERAVETAPAVQARPLRAATPVPKAAPAASKAVKPAAPQTVRCPYCSESVARSAYQAHVSENHPDE